MSSEPPRSALPGGVMSRVATPAAPRTPALSRDAPGASESSSPREGLAVSRGRLGAVGSDGMGGRESDGGLASSRESGSVRAGHGAARVDAVVPEAAVSRGGSSLSTSRSTASPPPERRPSSARCRGAPCSLPGTSPSSPTSPRASLVPASPSPAPPPPGPFGRSGEAGSASPRAPGRPGLGEGGSRPLDRAAFPLARCAPGAPSDPCPPRSSTSSLPPLPPLRPPTAGAPQTSGRDEATQGPSPRSPAPRSASPPPPLRTGREFDPNAPTLVDHRVAAMGNAAAHGQANSASALPNEQANPASALPNEQANPASALPNEQAQSERALPNERAQSERPFVDERALLAPRSSAVERACVAPSRCVETSSRVPSPSSGSSTSLSSAALLALLSHEPPASPSSGSALESAGSSPDPRSPRSVWPCRALGAPPPATARVGRERQRYGPGGERLVAGCVAWRRAAAATPGEAEGGQGDAPERPAERQRSPAIRDGDVAKADADTSTHETSVDGIVRVDPRSVLGAPGEPSRNGGVDPDESARRNPPSFDAAAGPAISYALSAGRVGDVDGKGRPAQDGLESACPPPPLSSSGAPSSSHPCSLVPPGFEVLLLTRTGRGGGLSLPKGGWETDEGVEEAAARETVEEAGVRGELDATALGAYAFFSKSGRAKLQQAGKRAREGAAKDSDRGNATEPGSTRTADRDRTATHDAEAKPPHQEGDRGQRPAPLLPVSMPLSTASSSTAMQLSMPLQTSGAGERPTGTAASLTKPLLEAGTRAEPLAAAALAALPLVPARGDCIAVVFSMRVQEELSSWPEAGVRKRVWVPAAEAPGLCAAEWQRDALADWARRLLQDPPRDNPGAA